MDVYVNMTLSLQWIIKCPQLCMQNNYYHRALFMRYSTLSPNSALDLFIGFNTGDPGSVIQLTPDNSNPR